MPIGNAPINESIAGGVVSPIWANWFAKIVTALKGWRETRFDTLLTISFGSAPAESKYDVNVSVPGVKFGDIPLLAPKNGYLPGLIYTAYVSADDFVTISIHNYTTSASGTFDADFYLITFRQ